MAWVSFSSDRLLCVIFQHIFVFPIETSVSQLDKLAVFSIHIGIFAHKYRIGGAYIYLLAHIRLVANGFIKLVNC